jgi:dienelactone hydrolase
MAADLIQNATFVVFRGVGSGFMDDGSDGFDAAASLEAQRRLIEFFRLNLPAPRLERMG